MKRFTGIVCSGFGLATNNFAYLVPVIERCSGLQNLTPGTFNVRIPTDYVIQPLARLTGEEYGGQTVKVQRCLVNGYKAVITRPETHELLPNYGHGKNHFEIMAPFHFRTKFGLNNGDEVQVEIEGDDAWWEAGKET